MFYSQILLFLLSLQPNHGFAQEIFDKGYRLPNDSVSKDFTLMSEALEEDYLTKYIFKPLKMKNTIAYVKGINEVKNRALGYSKNQGKWIRKDQSSTSATLGDGGIYSNLEDLFKWDAALYSDKILPQQIWSTAFEEQSLQDGTKIAYGFGWHLKNTSPHQKVVYHTGSTTSFRNIFYRIPSERLSIILLTNRNSPQEVDMVTLAERIVYHLII